MKAKFVPVEEDEDGAVVGVEVHHCGVDAGVVFVRWGFAFGDGFDEAIEFGLPLFVFEFPGLLKRRNIEGPMA